MNRRYLGQLSDEELAQQIRPYLEDAYGEVPVSSIWLERLAALIRNELNEPGDAVEAAEWAFVETFEYNEHAREALASEPARPVLTRLVAEVAAVVLLDDQTAHSILQNLYASFQASHGWDIERLSQPIGAALTGRVTGLPLPQVMALIGKEGTLQRLGAALR